MKLQQGFTTNEILVALGVGTVIILMTMSLILSSKKTTEQMNQLSDMNAFFLDLQNSLRKASFCSELLVDANPTIDLAKIENSDSIENGAPISMRYLNQIWQSGSQINSNWSLKELVLYQGKKMSDNVATETTYYVATLAAHLTDGQATKIKHIADLPIKIKKNKIISCEYFSSDPFKRCAQVGMMWMPGGFKGYAADPLGCVPFTAMK